jgi:hypothetical protein
MRIMKLTNPKTKLTILQVQTEEDPLINNQIQGN